MTQPCAGRPPNDLGQNVEPILILSRRRLRDTIDGADLERADRRLRTGLRQVRNHDHGRRPQLHDLLEKIEPVHLGHFDIEGDDIGIEFANGGASLERIGRACDDLDLRVARQRVPEQRAHGRRIIDDDDPNFFRHAFLPPYR